MISILEDKQDAVVRLCARHHVHRLGLFGSAASGKFNEVSSDLDFVVEFNDIPPSEHADAYFGLLEDLQQVFNRPVDLVERRAIRNPYFLQAVDQGRVEVYAAA